ncbi:ImuA family protein [Falsiroseomonas sp. CW058]|uniref:ImuA family protein n=1 Tax=Falsiroseomonas sp. CW058 TaxID=3388664 RepID=UPI003D31AD7A
MTPAPLPPGPDGPPHGPPLDRQALLAALRARAARGGRPGAGQEAVPLAAGIDPALPGGGLARAGLHEVLAGDPGAAAGFCAMVLGRTAGPVLWIAPEAEAWPSGLGRFGLPPAQLVLVRAAQGADALWAMEEALRCPTIGGALLMLRDIDTAAARRLQLAAGTGGALGLLLRPDGDAPAAGTALTSWRVSALPSQGAGAGALGDPRWQLDLLRCRGGAARGWATTWRASLDRLDLDAPAEAPEEAAAPARRAAGRRR